MSAFVSVVELQALVEGLDSFEIGRPEIIIRLQALIAEARSKAAGSDRLLIKTMRRAIAAEDDANALRRRISEMEIESEQRPYPCGATIAGTGEQCVRESDHSGPHCFESDVAPEGWRLVPLEATVDMMRCGELAYRDKEHDMYSPTPTEEPGSGPLGACWSAMVRSAPERPRA